jgi:hypothetical protein
MPRIQLVYSNRRAGFVHRHLRQRYRQNSIACYAAMRRSSMSVNMPWRRSSPNRRAPVWSKISNALKRLRFRSRNFLAQLLSETSRECNNPGSTIKFREALECFGRTCWPTSLEWSIRSSCCGTSIWRQRTGSSEVRSRVGCCFRKSPRLRAGSPTDI